MPSQNNGFSKATRSLCRVACAVFMMSAPVAFAAETGKDEVVSITLKMKNLPDYLVNDDMPAEVKGLVRRGELTAALGKLEELVKGAGADKKSARGFAAEIHRLKALQKDFSTGAEEVLGKIRRQIPDVTMADVDRWTENNSLYWLPVDGKVAYFRREPGILTRCAPDAKARVKQVQVSSDEDNMIVHHMEAALKAAKDTGSSVVLPVRYHVTHTVNLKPGIVPSGEVVRCWLPYPREDVFQQRDVKLVSMSPTGKVNGDDEAAQRTVYMEQKAGEDGSAKFVLKFDYTFGALVPDFTKPRTGGTEPGESTYGKSHVTPSAPMDAEYLALAKKIVGDEKDPVNKARLIWRWIDENVKWVPEMEYLVMTNIAQKVLTEKRGDCGTQAILFARLCTAVGVEARWQSGWTMQPDAWNMHDWAEFFAPGLGWLPADPSRGRKKHSDPAVVEFMFGNIDSYRMVANNDFCSLMDDGGGLVPPKEHFRSDPVDNQRGELEWKGGNLYYDQWSYSVDVNQEPVK